MFYCLIDIGVDSGCIVTCNFANSGLSASSTMFKLIARMYIDSSTLKSKNENPHDYEVSYKHENYVKCYTVLSSFLRTICTID